MALLERLRRLFRRDKGAQSDLRAGTGAVRGETTHIIILDGTMSSLEPGQETNAGLAYKILRAMGRGPGRTIYYEPGIQWSDWSGTVGVMTGKGINRQIRRAYGVLCSRYKPGDRIILIGYSRGAYAVRSLAGVMDRVGLLRQDAAIVRNIRQAYRLYRQPGNGALIRSFRTAHCHEEAAVEAVAVWDTVKALSFRFPLLWRLLPDRNAFHNHELGAVVRHGFHALALDETRNAYQPVMWNSPPDWPGRVEQVWFRGNHADVGGQLGGRTECRPLSNIPFVWLMSRLEACGVEMPEGWRLDYPQDVTAPSSGLWSGWGKIFLVRRRRRVGRCTSEALHASIAAEESARYPALGGAISV